MNEMPQQKLGHFFLLKISEKQEKDSKHDSKYESYDRIIWSEHLIHLYLAQN